MELELKHLAPYLPYGLQIHSLSDNFTINVKGIFLDNTGIKYISDFGEDYATYMWDVKPLLMPLSFMLEDIICEQFFEDDSELLGDEFSAKKKAIDFIKNHKNEKVCQPIWFWELCYRLHIDIFGLIDAGLALNKNDLK